MANRTHTGFLLSVLAAGMIGCSGAVSPTAPSAAVPQPTSSSGVYAVLDVTLSGVVYEVTPAGRVPIEGVHVFLSRDQDIITDADGFFRFRPVWVFGGSTVIWVGKDGYDDVTGQPGVPEYNGQGWRQVTINGDTRVDFQLVKQ